jgi:hypothetical protein
MGRLRLADDEKAAVWAAAHALTRRSVAELSAEQGGVVTPL